MNKCVPTRPCPIPIFLKFTVERSHNANKLRSWRAVRSFYLIFPPCFPSGISDEFYRHRPLPFRVHYRLRRSYHTPLTFSSLSSGSLPNLQTFIYIPFHAMLLLSKSFVSFSLSISLLAPLLLAASDTLGGSTILKRLQRILRAVISLLIRGMLICIYVL